MKTIDVYPLTTIFDDCIKIEICSINNKYICSIISMENLKYENLDQYFYLIEKYKIRENMIIGNKKPKIYIEKKLSKKNIIFALELLEEKTNIKYNLINKNCYEIEQDIDYNKKIEYKLLLKKLKLSKFQIKKIIKIKKNIKKSKHKFNLKYLMIKIRIKEIEDLIKNKNILYKNIQIRKRIDIKKNIIFKYLMNENIIK